jgi:hypothetical protein
MGRSDIFLKLEIIKKVVGVFILLVSLPFGVYALAIGQIVSSITSSCINAQPNKRLLGYSYLDQIQDILPSFLLSLLMGIVTSSLYFLHLSPLSTMVLQIFSGIFVYLVLAKLFKLECYGYLMDTLRSLFKRKT